MYPVTRRRWRDSEALVNAGYEVTRLKDARHVPAHRTSGINGLLLRSVCNDYRLTDLW